MLRHALSHHGRWRGLEVLSVRVARTSQCPRIDLRIERPGWRPLHLSCRLRPCRSTSLYKSFEPSHLEQSAIRGHLRRSHHFRRWLATRQSPSTEPKPLPPTPGPENFTSEISETDEELSESPYTIPNALTLARIFACPFLGYEIIHGQYEVATGLLFACGVSDWLDGYLARRWGGKSVLGSILDPAADKFLMTTLVVTLAWAGLLPTPLAVLILGRDVALSISAFYFRFISLPPPRTLSRYWNPSIPSAEVKPTQISKINTALQLVLMGVTTVSPLVSYPLAIPLQYLQWTVAGTTIWSGLSYVGRAGVRILPRGGSLTKKD